ncbi:MAG: hypothetical protein QG618_1609, partial [Thermodesulfobacteriota bacterium]|nr:hypothetical protein [Thermodesulfobacteriota bacterium]
DIDEQVAQKHGEKKDQGKTEEKLRPDLK